MLSKLKARITLLLSRSGLLLQKCWACINDAVVQPIIKTKEPVLCHLIVRFNIRMSVFLIIPTESFIINHKFDAYVPLSLSTAVHAAFWQHRLTFKFTRRAKDFQCISWRRQWRWGFISVQKKTRVPTITKKQSSSKIVSFCFSTLVSLCIHSCYSSLKCMSK